MFNLSKLWGSLHGIGACLFVLDSHGDRRLGIGACLFVLLQKQAQSEKSVVTARL